MACEFPVAVTVAEFLRTAIHLVYFYFTFSKIALGPKKWSRDPYHGLLKVICRQKVLSWRPARRLWAVLDRRGSNWYSTWFGFVIISLKRVSSAKLTSSATVEMPESHSPERMLRRRVWRSLVGVDDRLQKQILMQTNFFAASNAVTAVGYAKPPHLSPLYVVMICWIL